MMSKPHQPSFTTWQRDTLDKFTHEIWDQNLKLRQELEAANLRTKDLESALAQAQSDRRDAMKLARENVADWR